MAVDFTTDELDEVASLIARSSCNVALTGAGVSTASGIPDFRGPQGVWRRVDPEKFEISYFYNNPDEVWDLFIRYLLPAFDAKPNPAHYALAEMERLGKLCAVITQNVDRLHQAAGSKNVIELHGALEYAVCTNCGSKYALAEALKWRKSGAPRCPKCGGVIKPDVVFFGEPLPQDALREAFMLAEMAEVFMAIGTSLAVYPANQLPLVAKKRGAKLVIINADETYYDFFADYIIRGRAEEVLPKLLDRLRGMLF
ncbi:NAD-dependent protein deacetylase [Pyrobaculum aerophilum]|uniref:NAD-dependent protein deacetylase n=1 Tax=Pyrobaculum aerophilum TaxID=13773 RepID=A0A371R744_9CREN|nr:NAD-dependent protein deacetylase [Pyrobaculum aerophilum]RFA93475.1 NAD-dependent protein deacylase [Pyrobaculum aerophilum]RFB00340.1 NAD-dependent protein deacylase [Pyrobaculum aerophilum]